MRLSNTSSLQIKLWAVLLPVLMITACSEPPEEKAVEVEARPVKIFTINSDNNSFSLEYPGVIAAKESVDLGFEVQGKIIELPIVDGQKVVKGEVLAKLDPTDYVAARDAARSNHYALNSVYQRAKKIFDLGAGSQAEIDIALRDVRVAKQQLKTAQKALNDTILVSPLNGEVARKIADNFQNIQAKEPVLLLQDISDLEIDITIPEQDFTQIDTNLTSEQHTAKVRPEVVLSAIPGRRFPARFKSSSGAADPVMRTYLIKMIFDNPEDVTILPGMTAKVVITLNGENSQGSGMGGFLIPTSSVASDELGNAYAWLINQDTMQVSKVSVDLGTMSDSRVRILKGLNLGDKIVMSGVHYLQEGAKVRPLGEK